MAVIVPWWMAGSFPAPSGGACPSVLGRALAPEPGLALPHTSPYRPAHAGQPHPDAKDQEPERRQHQSPGSHQLRILEHVRRIGSDQLSADAHIPASSGPIATGLVAEALAGLIDRLGGAGMEIVGADGEIAAIIFGRHNDI